MAAEDRWPPIYDAAQLQETIQRLVQTAAIEKRLYDPRPRERAFFQGDVFRLPVDWPFIDGDGQAVAMTAPPFWMVLGNSCDLSRSIELSPFTQIAPVYDHSVLGSRAFNRDALRKYAYATQFYLPPWGMETSHLILVTDFLRPATIHRYALNQAEVVARLSWEGWLLFHACLVRFLARDDGRND